MIALFMNPLSMSIIDHLKRQFASSYDDVDTTVELSTREACGEGPLSKKIAASIFPAKESRVNHYSLPTPTMRTSQRGPLSLFSSLLIALVLNFVSPTHALYFYLDGASASPKCFYEELPKDTLVVGETRPPPAPFKITSHPLHHRPLQRPSVSKQRLCHKPGPIHHGNRR